MFEGVNYVDALKLADETDVWIVDKIIGASTTLLFGEAKVGKSFLVSALIESLTTGRDFLGKSVPQDRDFSVAVCWTDDAGAQEYSTRIRTVMPEDASPNVNFYRLPIMRTQAMWQSLFHTVMADGHNFVVIDNLAQCLPGSVNADDVVREFFDGVRLFINAGIPVVVVAHSTDKAGPFGKPETPLGSAYISQAVRWRCFIRRSKRGNMTLKFMGNNAEPYEMTLHHGAGARFEVIDVKDSEAVKAQEESQRRRSADRLDENEKFATWVVENCQGKGVNSAATELSEFAEKSYETCRSMLRANGTLAKLLSRSGEGASTTWKLVATG